MAQDLLGLNDHIIRSPVAQSHPSGSLPVTLLEANCRVKTKSVHWKLEANLTIEKKESQPRVRRQRSSQVVTKSFVLFEDPDMIRAVHAARDKTKYGPNEGDGSSAVPSNEATTKTASPCAIAVDSPFYSDSDDIFSEDEDLKVLVFLTHERLALNEKLPEKTPSSRIVQWMDEVSMPLPETAMADIFEFVDPSSSEDAHAIPSPFAAVVVDPTSPSSAGNPASTHCPNTGEGVSPGATEESLGLGSKVVGSEEQQSLQTIAVRLSHSIRTMSGSAKESPAVYGSMLSDLITALGNVAASCQDRQDLVIRH